MLETYEYGMKRYGHQSTIIQIACLTMQPFVFENINWNSFRHRSIYAYNLSCLIRFLLLYTP